MPRARTYSPSEKARVASLFGILGILLILFSMVMLNFRKETRVILAGSNAVGKVVFLERSRIYNPIVRFYTAEGRAIEFRSISVGDGSGTYSLDQRVPVRYIASDPTEAYVANFAGLYGHFVYRVPVAVLFLFAGVALLWAHRRMAATMSLTQCAMWSLGIAALFWLSIVATNRNLSSSRVPREQVEHEQRNAAALLASVGTPPGASPYSPPIERAYGGVRATATLEQQFEAPGRFADTKEWYRQQLEPKGWRIFNPAETSEGRVEWCKAPWMFTIWSGDYEGASSPTHQYGARVEWRSWFTSDRCPL